ncbi:putative O-methyltransferase YrrM [Sinorhizobium fredii]|uniref:class I SAM-dependent methyltransferase n=1 Tax=Rhizobium fredii TaxID=380 RepID=UPI003511E509
MLEKIGAEGYHTISRPDTEVVSVLKNIMASVENPRVGEFGVGIGATTLPMARLLDGKGEIHVFDFHASVEELVADLKNAGYRNIVPHGNTNRYWDSYHWSLAMMLKEPANLESFDLIYIDGAHTYLHDALAFFMCDRLLKVGGHIYFDDYVWRYADSRYMKDVRNQYMTKEQEEAYQIKMFIDDLVQTHAGYECVLENNGFKKILTTQKT